MESARVRTAVPAPVCGLLDAVRPLLALCVRARASARCLANGEALRLGLDAAAGAPLTLADLGDGRGLRRESMSQRARSLNTPDLWLA